MVRSVDKADASAEAFKRSIKPATIYHFQWDGPNTAVSTPFNRLWWFISHTTLYIHTVYWIKWQHKCSLAAARGALPKMAVTMGICLCNPRIFLWVLTDLTNP